MESEFTADAPNSNFMSAAGEVMPADKFDGQSQLPPREYFKKQVEELHQKGALERPIPIRQATLDYIENSKKDAISLLNCYVTVSGQPPFQYYDYELAGRPDNNKFIMVSELDGHMVIGGLQPSKKEAKRACAQRILDMLVSTHRLNCLNETGRKIKHVDKHPRPLPNLPAWHQNQTMPPNVQNELASLNAEYYKEQPTDPMLATFAEDIDLDAGAGKQLENVLPLIPPEIKMEFDKVNPVPADCKDPATFEQVRAHALKLFCENAFWSEVKMDEPVRQKLIEAGMWSESWNALQFVHKCVQRANSWIKSAEEPMAEDQPKTSNDGENAAEDQAMPAAETERKTVAKYSIEFFTFTLPYIPPRYASLVSFNGQLLHGQLSESKAKAKTSAALVLATKFVNIGWVDLDKMPKKAPKKAAPNKTTTKRKRVAEDSMDDQSDQSAASSEQLQSYQYLLTLHPYEVLDPRTHFLLASYPNKNPILLLNEECGMQKIELPVKYQEMSTTQATQNSPKFLYAVLLQPFRIPGLPVEVTGAPFSVYGIPERSKKMAKWAAARAGLDALVRRGGVQTNEREFADFKAAIKRAKLCECCGDEKTAVAPDEEEKSSQSQGQQQMEEEQSSGGNYQV